MGEYMRGAGEDMVEIVPEDYVPEPAGFMPAVESPEVRAWALEVHSLWKNLSRKVSKRVEDRPELHTLLSLPNPVMIPGSRFREVYYWDSYWVIRLVLFTFQASAINPKTTITIRTKTKVSLIPWDCQLWVVDKIHKINEPKNYENGSKIPHYKTRF